MNKFTSDGTLGGYFVSNGTRGSGKEEILRSYHEAKEAAKALSWLGWGKSVCFEEVPPELPWESEWKQDGKKQLDVFYHLLMEKEKKEACRFQKNLYEELVRRHMHMSSTVRYIYCQMQEMLEKAAENFYPGNMEKPWEQNGTDFFWQAETFAEMRDEMIRRIEQLLKRSEDGKEKKKTENSFTISKVNGIHTGTLCRDGSVDCQNCRFGLSDADVSVSGFQKADRAHHRTVSAGNPCGACQTENERSAAEVLSDLRAGWVCGCQLFCKNFQKDDRHDTNRI